MGRPRYQRPPRPSKLEPYKAEIHRLLADEPNLPAVRVRELIEPLGYRAGQTILECLPARGAPAVRPAAPDLPAHPLPTGRDLPVRPVGAEPPDPGGPRPRAPRLGGGGLPGLLARRRRSAHLLQAGPRHPLGHRPVPLAPGRPAPDARVGSRGSPARRRRPAERRLRRLLRPAAGRLAPLRGGRPAGQGGRRAPAGVPGDQLRAGALIRQRARLRTISWTPGFARRTAAPIAPFAVDPSIAWPRTSPPWRPLPEAPPDLDPRIVLRVPADPHVRVDTCDYSLDPRLVGRRVEVRIGQREITAVALDSGEIAARHRRSFARHRTITDLEHLRRLRARRRRARPSPRSSERPLARYDALIPA